MNGILNEASLLDRRPDFLPVDILRKSDESLWWDENGLDINTNGNDPVIFELSKLEIINVDDDFMSKLEGAYSSCNYFSNEKIERRLRQKIEISHDGLFRYHNRLVILRPKSTLIEGYY